MTEDKKRIPTLMALLILLLGVGGGIFFAEYSLEFLSKRKDENGPTQIRLSNLTAKTASISWITNEAEKGEVIYGTAGSKLELLGVDDRIGKENKDKFTTHHITLRNLSPDTKYEFILVSGGKKYGSGGKPYQFKTYKESRLSELEPSYGVVKTKNGSPAKDAIVFIKPPNALPLSTLTRKNGEWAIPLNTAYNIETGKPIETFDKKNYTIYILAEKGETAQAIVNTQKDNPVPEIVLGREYDFTKNQNAQVANKVLGAKAANQDKADRFVVVQPAEKQVFSTNKPQIRGKGIPGSSVSIILQSAPQTGVVKVDERGDWSWTPPRSLSPGDHTIIVNSFNERGEPVKITRKFLVLKSGRRVLGESTPSATLAPSPTRLPSPTTAPELETPTPTTQEATPVSGSTFPVYIIILAGIVFVFLGLRPGIIYRDI